MFAELYHAAFLYIASTTPLQALLVFSFILAFFLYIPVFVVSYFHRKKDKELNLPIQILYYLVLVFLGWGVLLVLNGSSLGHIFSIWKLALLGLAVYLPTWFVYNKIMERWPKLPWMVVQFVFIWLVSLGIWYYLIFLARIFGEGVFIQI